MKATSVYGLVLSGGKSSRMGKDKGLLTYHHKPQREYLFELLSKYCEVVFTSCRSDQKMPDTLNPVVDHYAFESPLNGIMSAFGKYPDKAWLIVAVDMPYVNENALGFLIKHRDPQKVATCFYNAEAKLPEPLLTLWEPLAYPLLLKFLEEGKISPRDFLKRNDVKMIDPPEEGTLMNVNSPEDLQGLTPSW
jgi:molybdopterin-guanine dinucleotide biosynthesis protein A